MATLIKLKKSAVPGKIPDIDQLAYGELALNYADWKLYFKTSENTVECFSVSPEHKQLLGLTEDDHPQYVHLDAVRTITAPHIFNPSISGPPFILGPNALGQLVVGLNTELLDGQPSSYYYSPANKPVVTERYEFTDALRWIVNHNKNTTQFSEVLTDETGNRFYAKLNIIDENSFVVDMTSAISGAVDVTFVL